MNLSKRWVNFVSELGLIDREISNLFFTSPARNAPLLRFLFFNSYYLLLEGYSKLTFVVKAASKYTIVGCDDHGVVCTAFDELNRAKSYLQGSGNQRNPKLRVFSF